MINTTKIKDIREDNDITQKKMANILGVKRSAYSLWEIGHSTMSINNLIDFADYFELSLDYTLGLTKMKGTSTLKKGMDYKVLGENIRKMRIHLNLTQKRLADLIGVTQPCIVKYERGTPSISIDKLYALSKVFHVSLSTLCGKEKKKTDNKYEKIGV